MQQSICWWEPVSTSILQELYWLPIAFHGKFKMLSFSYTVSDQAVYLMDRLFQYTPICALSSPEEILFPSCSIRGWGAAGGEYNVTGDQNLQNIKASKLGLIQIEHQLTGEVLSVQLPKSLKSSLWESLWILKSIGDSAWGCCISIVFLQGDHLLPKEYPSHETVLNVTAYW